MMGIISCIKDTINEYKWRREKNAQNRVFLDDLKARGIILKISNVELGSEFNGNLLHVYDENYGEIWICFRDGDLSYGDRRCFFDGWSDDPEGEYGSLKEIGFDWDEDSVTFKYKKVGYRGNSDRYFEKKFNAYKEVISMREL